MANWVDFKTMTASCPKCDGAGYVDDDTDDPPECDVCEGTGVAELNAANDYLQLPKA